MSRTFRLPRLLPTSTAARSCAPTTRAVALGVLALALAAPPLPGDDGDAAAPVPGTPVAPSTTASQPPAAEESASLPPDAATPLNPPISLDEITPPRTGDHRPVEGPAERPARIPPGEFPFDFIRDRTSLKGTADRNAYYGLLDYVRHVNPAELDAAAARFVAQRWAESPYKDWPLEEFPLFADLIEHPEAYRGQPITLRGHIQLHRVYHQQNDYGLDPLHEVYLFTDDSQGHPLTVVFTENPDRIPAGEDRISGVHVTGYFLKLMTYPARDGKNRYSPLILARAVRWRPVSAPSISLETQLVITVGVLIAVVLLATAVRRNQQADALARQRERELLGENQPPDFSQLH